MRRINRSRRAFDLSSLESMSKYGEDDFVDPADSDDEDEDITATGAREVGAKESGQSRARETHEPSDTALLFFDFTSRFFFVRTSQIAFSRPTGRGSSIESLRHRVQNSNRDAPPRDAHTLDPRARALREARGAARVRAPGAPGARRRAGRRRARARRDRRRGARRAPVRTPRRSGWTRARTSARTYPTSPPARSSPSRRRQRTPSPRARARSSPSRSPSPSRARPREEKGKVAANRRGASAAYKSKGPRRISPCGWGRNPARARTARPRRTTAGGADARAPRAPRRSRAHGDSAIGEGKVTRGCVFATSRGSVRQRRVLVLSLRIVRLLHRRARFDRPRPELERPERPARDADGGGPRARPQGGVQEMDGIGQRACTACSGRSRGTPRAQVVLEQFCYASGHACHPATLRGGTSSEV